MSDTDGGTWEERVVELLESIDGSLKVIADAARRRMPKPVATDRDLDGKYGNPKVTFNPRDWSGPSCKGLKMSDCPAPFLEMLAETLDYFASQAEQKNETYNGKLVAPYKRADAARARGWAKRIKDGVHVPPTAVAGSNGASVWSDDTGAGEWGDPADPPQGDGF